MLEGVVNMSDLFLIGVSGCGGLEPIVRLIRRGVFPLVQIVIPILLIILGTFDLGKAVIVSDEKEVKTAQSRLIKRFIYAALIFFVTTLVTVLMNIVAAGKDADTNATGWFQCWNEV